MSKLLFRGVHLNDKYGDPLTNFDNNENNVLGNSVDWPDEWYNMECSTRTLRKETHSVWKQIMYAIIEILSVCKTELGLEYIIQGKFQTDNL